MLADLIQLIGSLKESYSMLEVASHSAEEELNMVRAIVSNSHLTHFVKQDPYYEARS